MPLSHSSVSKYISVDFSAECLTRAMSRRGQSHEQTCNILQNNWHCHLKKENQAKHLVSI